jgi:hypothetical protein
MSTTSSFCHRWVVRQALLALHEQIDRRDLGTTIMAPIGVFMPGCDPVQPDLLVVPAADRTIIRGGRIEGVPALLVEVQSPSSVGYDDRIKDSTGPSANRRVLRRRSRLDAPTSAGARAHPSPPRSAACQSHLGRLGRANGPAVVA